MRASRTIGEWMDHVREWSEVCEHGNAATTCSTCIGALHPVLSATTRHLMQLLTLKNPKNRMNSGQLLNLTIETQALFTKISETFADLTDIERFAGETEKAAERELRDIAIIANDVRTLVDKFKPHIPDVTQHVITAAVRQMQV